MDDGDDSTDDAFWAQVLLQEEDTLREHAAKSNAPPPSPVGGAAIFPNPALSVAQSADNAPVASIAASASNANRAPHGGFSHTANAAAAYPNAAPSVAHTAAANASNPSNSASASHAKRSAPRPPIGAAPPAVEDEDSYTRRLREKDAQLSRAVQTKNGEIANLKHRIRALEAKLSARYDVRARVPAAVAPHPPRGGAEADRARLSKEAAITKADLNRMSEQLLFAKQEIAALTERELERLARAEESGGGGVRGSGGGGGAGAGAGAGCEGGGGEGGGGGGCGGGVSAFQQPQFETPPPLRAVRTQQRSQRPPAVPAVSSADFPEPGMLGMSQAPPLPLPSSQAQAPFQAPSQTQAPSGNECVEATQMPGAPSRSGYNMSRRENRRPRVRRSRRCLGPSDERGSSSYEADVSPSHLLSRAILSAEEMPPPPSIGRGSGKRGRGEENVKGEAEVQVLWRDRPREGQVGTCREEDVESFGMVDEWELRELRAALFGEGRAERLLQISNSRGRKELHRAITRAMASDLVWIDLLFPLSELVVGGAAELALTALCALVEYHHGVRVALASSAAHSVVVGRVLEALEGASAPALQPAVASLALRIMSCIVSEIALMGDEENEEGELDKPAVAVAVRRRLEHDSVLIWLQQQDVSMSLACCAAAEIASELIMNIIGTPVAQYDQREGDFLEQAVLCFAAALPVLTVPASVKDRALCSLDWTSRVAPYFLDEKDARVMENVCIFFVDAVHRMRLRVKFERSARRQFCEILDIESSCGDTMQIATPHCWQLAVEGSEDVKHGIGNDGQVAAVTRAVSIARRLVQRGASGDISFAADVAPATRNVALSTLAFLGWPDKDKKTQRYPAVDSLHDNPSLASDAQIVFDALLRAESPPTTGETTN